MIVTENEFVLPPIADTKIDMRRDQPLFREEVIDRLWIENRIRISCVAKRIRKQAAYSQLFVRRPADVCNRSAVPILIVRPGVIGVEPARSD